MFAEIIKNILTVAWVSLDNSRTKNVKYRYHIGHLFSFTAAYDVCLVSFYE